MDWLSSLRGAIEYMEKHMLEPISPADIARAVLMSPFYLQKGFQIIPGYSLGEYMRNRRLYLAALELLSGEVKVIDAALRYGYQTPESFSKAFTRFHGFPPSQVKKECLAVRPFLPLKVKISIQGGKDVDYFIEKMDAFQILGFQRRIPMDRGYELCPKFWDEIQRDYLAPLHSGRQPQGDLERAVKECCVGLFGVCIEEDDDPGAFTYMAAGHYDGRPVPEGMAVREIPAATWAKFRAQGPLPGSLQTLNSQIFQEWLPGNQQYELAFPINIELYPEPDTENSPDYECYIWLPVKEKKL